MKRLLGCLLILILFTSVACSQQVTGHWRGLLEQNPGGVAIYYVYEMKLTQQGEKVSGTAHIELVDDQQSFADFRVAGTFRGGKLVLEDQEIIKQNPPPGAGWLMKKLTGRIDPDLRLAGDWSSDGHDGTFSLAKPDVDKQRSESSPQ